MDLAEFYKDIPDGASVVFDWDNTLKLVNKTSKTIECRVSRNFLRALVEEKACHMYIISAIRPSRMNMETLLMEVDKLGLRELFCPRWQQENRGITSNRNDTACRSLLKVAEVNSDPYQWSKPSQRNCHTKPAAVKTEMSKESGKIFLHDESSTLSSERKENGAIPMSLAEEIQCHEQAGLECESEIIETDSCIDSPTGKNVEGETISKSKPAWRLFEAEVEEPDSFCVDLKSNSIRSRPLQMQDNIDLIKVSDLKYLNASSRLNDDDLKWTMDLTSSKKAFAQERADVIKTNELNGFPCAQKTQIEENNQGGLRYVCWGNIVCCGYDKAEVFLELSRKRETESTHSENRQHLREVWGWREPTFRREQFHETSPYLSAGIKRFIPECEVEDVEVDGLDEMDGGKASEDLFEEIADEVDGLSIGTYDSRPPEHLQKRKAVVFFDDEEVNIVNFGQIVGGSKCIWVH